MSETKWTPGPLRVEAVYGEGNELFWHAVLDEYGKYVVTTWLPKYFDESLANATLYAAAEDLYEALNRLANEVIGSLPLMEVVARQEMGNTNYAILIQRANEETEDQPVKITIKELKEDAGPQ